MIEYIKLLIYWFDICVKEGECDFFEVCRNSFVYGVLLVLCYIFEELDWNFNVVLFSVLEMREEFEKFFKLVMWIIILVLWVVFVDVLCLDEDMDDIVDDDSFLLDV